MWAVVLGFDEKNIGIHGDFFFLKELPGCIESSADVGSGE